MSATYQFRAWKGLEISCGRKNNILQHPPCKHLKNEWLSGRLTGKRLVCGLHSMDQREFFCSIIQQPWCTVNTHQEYPPFLIQMNRHLPLKPSRRHICLNIQREGGKVPCTFKSLFKIPPMGSLEGFVTFATPAPQTPCLMNVLYNTKLNKWWSCPR